MSRLFESFSTPDLALKNRIVMPPMTRCKSQQPGNIATELMAEYYAQRATATSDTAHLTSFAPHRGNK